MQSIHDTGRRGPQPRAVNAASATLAASVRERLAQILDDQEKLRRVDAEWIAAAIRFVDAVDSLSTDTD